VKQKFQYYFKLRLGLFDNRIIQVLKNCLVAVRSLGLGLLSRFCDTASSSSVIIPVTLSMQFTYNISSVI